jgi:hypothetical protein
MYSRAEKKKKKITVKEYSLKETQLNTATKKNRSTLIPIVRNNPINLPYFIACERTK